MKFIKKAIGISKEKHWLLIPIFAGCTPLLVVVVLFFFLQKKFFIYLENTSKDPITQTVNYRFMVKTLDGFQMSSFEFARYYENRANQFTFYPPEEIKLEVIANNPQTHQKILAIWGRNTLSNQVLALVTYTHGE